MVGFDVRAVSRFFAGPEAGQKCVHALFLCPLFKSFEAYTLDYVDASGLGIPFVQAGGHRLSANIVLWKAATWQRC